MFSFTCRLCHPSIHLLQQYTWGRAQTQRGTLLSLSFPRTPWALPMRTFGRQAAQGNSTGRRKCRETLYCVLQPCMQAAPPGEENVISGNPHG